MDLRYADKNTIVSLLQSTVKPILFLGAGASKKSGIPLASEIIEEIAKWSYCNSQGMDVDDPRLTMSDWKKWMKNYPWYSEGNSDLYPQIVDELLRPQAERRKFFLRIIHPNLNASRGYEIVAELMHLGLINTVLTTNFDNCLYEASIQVRMPPYFNSIKTPFDLDKMLSYVPIIPQLIYLHGSVEHYTDQNLTDEVSRLNTSLSQALIPILKDRPIIVIGYRGAEQSIMNDLFIKNLQATNKFHNGIYWCIKSKSYSSNEEVTQSLTPYLIELAEKAERNFQFIKIDGFDETMIEIMGLLRSKQIDLRNVLDGQIDIEEPKEIQPADVNGIDTIGTLEVAFIRERVKNYSDRLDIKVYDEESWLNEQMLRLRIARRTKDNKYELTASGILLFSSNTQNYLPHAVTILKFIGDKKWLKNFIDHKLHEDIEDGDVSNESIERTISGNIWNQLNEITDALSIVNKAFRLKGDVSENVYPYPTLALKEIIVNTLVHRDYRKPCPIIIEVHETHICFRNPGGLVEEVKRQIKDNSLEDIIKTGKRGIKGYRNPVIADLFYGSGAMDKEGSGLSDVVKKVELNSGSVSFGPTENEDNFEVIIYKRPESISEETQTATPLRINETVKFACNLLEVLDLPDAVYHGETSARVKRDIWQNSQNRWLPPYFLADGRIWSFFDLSSRDNPLSRFVELGTVERLSIDEFIGITNDNRELVRMLNDCLEMHFFSIGLRVDRKKLRAYFPKTREGNPKEIQYQGRIKKARRTVAKPRINPTTGKIYYWEHKAIWFGFENLGKNWYLTINPTYVFTTDGYKYLLKSKRVNSLSTRKASRDYNLNVHNDLTFWSRYISGGNDGPFSLKFMRQDQENTLSPSFKFPNFVISSQLPSVVIHDISITEDFIEPDFLEDPDDIDKEIELIAQKELFDNSNGN